MQAVFAGAEFVHFTDGVGQGGNLAQTFAHGVYGFFGQSQAVEQGVVQTFLRSLFHILGVGGEDGGLVVFDEFGSAQERSVFLRGLGGSDNIGSLLGGGRGAADVVLNVLHGVSADKVGMG